MNYLVSDLVIRVKNAALAKRREVVLPYSNLNKEIGKVLVKQGFLENIKDGEVDGKKVLNATVKYYRRLPIMVDVQIISKPSLRVYTGSNDVPKFEKRGNKTVIVSTSQGVMTGKEAKKKGVGGEVLFAIW